MSRNGISRLGRGGALRLPSAPESDTVLVPARPEVGAASGDTGYFGREGGLPLDQRGDDALSLVFESEPLPEALEILGSARFEVTVESSRPVAALCVRVNDVPPEGAVARVTWTVRNLTLDDAGRTPRPLVPGEARRVPIVFPNTAWRFDAGHRVRLSISCGYWPIVWPAPRPARIVVHAAGARLVLPIRPAPMAEAPVTFAHPDEVKGPSTRDVIPARSLVRHVEHDGDGGAHSLGWHLPFRCVHFREIDLDFGVETRAEFNLDREDSESASVRFEHRLHFARGGWAVDVAGSAELRSTPDAFRVHGSLEARENGETVFERRWDPVIPRTCS